jgi:hypothetical protein
LKISLISNVGDPRGFVMLVMVAAVPIRDNPPRPLGHDRSARLEQHPNEALRVDRKAVAGQQQTAHDRSRDAPKHLAEVAGRQHVGANSLPLPQPTLKLG